MGLPLSTPISKPRRGLRIIGERPEPTDAEHLELALEFMDPEVGREYLRDQDRAELLEEFDRLTEEEAAALERAA